MHELRWAYPDSSASDPSDKFEPQREWLLEALSALRQPLSALECLLYIHKDTKAGETLEEVLLRKVIEEGLVECGRTLQLLRAIETKLGMTYLPEPSIVAADDEEQSHV